MIGNEFINSTSCLYSLIYTKQITPNQIETVSVPIVDLNEKGNSYPKLQVIKPYTTFNQETHFFKTPGIKKKFTVKNFLKSNISQNTAVKAQYILI